MIILSASRSGILCIHWSTNIFTVVSAFLKGPIEVISKIQKTFALWMAADLCGPLGEVIQQNLKSGHAVSEVSLEHPTACYWHLLRTNHSSFVIIYTHWTCKIKENGHSQKSIWSNLVFFSEYLEKGIRMLLYMNIILQQLQADPVGQERKFQLSWHQMLNSSGVEIDVMQLWCTRTLCLQYLQHTLGEPLVVVCVENIQLIIIQRWLVWFGPLTYSIFYLNWLHEGTNLNNPTYLFKIKLTT